MSLYPEARFLLSVNMPGQFPPDSGAEVAFAGRSNAGKSSAINAIVNRRQFARVSKTPGRTQLINFFSLGQGGKGGQAGQDRRLVDLPGYGFARVPESMRQHWGTLLQSYFERRTSLTGLVLVVDARRLLTAFDWQLLRLADSVSAPVHVLLTKADKLKRGRATDALRAAGKDLGAAATVQLFSATRKVGVDEARERMEAFLGSGRHDEAGPNSEHDQRAKKSRVPR